MQQVFPPTLLQQVIHVPTARYGRSDLQYLCSKSIFRKRFRNNHQEASYIHEFKLVGHSIYLFFILFCQSAIFPPENQISPVADQLRKVLATATWARVGLGLPVVSRNKPYSRRNELVSSCRHARKYLLSNLICWFTSAQHY